MHKYMKNIMIALACFALIALGYNATTADAAVPYTDVKAGSWYYATIDNLHAEGIVFGYNKSNQFRPDQAANRGETAQFIANALNLDTKNVKDPGFTDVPKSHPYYGAIAALANEGIINGVGNNKFDPNGQLQRVHIAKILTLAFELEMSNAKTSKFADVNAVAAKFKLPDYIKYVETLVEYGITTGMTPTTFSPESSVKRAQLATFLERALKETDSFGDFELIGVE